MAAPLHIPEPTAPLRIGKHDWRMRFKENPYEKGRLTFVYEWRKAATTVCGIACEPGYWRDQHAWPTYDTNNGMTGGMPKTLVKLWEANKHLLRSEPPAQPALL